MYAMKERVCITVDDEIFSKAKEHKVNVSMICQMALERELEMYTRNAYAKALENQISLHKLFLKTKGLWVEFESFKFNEDVGKENSKQTRIGFVGRNNY